MIGAGRSAVVVSDSAPQSGGAGERAVHLGAVRSGHGVTTVWTAALRACREECEEESGGSGGPEAGRLTTLPLGEWRRVRAAAQCDIGTDRGGSRPGEGGNTPQTRGFGFAGQDRS